MLLDLLKDIKSLHQLASSENEFLISDHLWEISKEPNLKVACEVSILV